MSGHTDWFDEHGWFVGEFPDECIKDCHHQGDCSADVEAWQQKLDFQVPRERAILWLLGFGAWERETDQYDKGLDDYDDVELAQTVLWLACGDFQEHGEWLGLVN